ncbi:hypothetical protein AU467_15065 [Mesorhizobium loti]|uniref:Uncharacterized protein n=1 Tax=Rhizobium loti TaxID=381 RepID=A0A101KVG3_RHILI|nr:hypothetical protein AU467_15065 [Mesorhizobium loti]
MGLSLEQFAELLSLFVAIPDGKPLRTFPGIALLPVAIPDGNRRALFLELRRELPATSQEMAGTPL